MSLAEEMVVNQAQIATSQDADAWDASTVYLGGDQATQDGKLWEAKWWTRGQAPKDNSG